MIPALERVREEIRSGRGRLLIIGMLSRHFDERIRNDPRLALWTADEAIRAKHIPEDIAAIVFGKFMGHKAEWRVQDLLGERWNTIWIYRRGRTVGEVRKIIAETLDLSLSKPKRGSRKRRSVSLPPPVPLTTIDEFLARHARLDAANRINEAKRLFRIAKRKELAVSKTALSNAYFALRRRARGNVVQFLKS